MKTEQPPNPEHPGTKHQSNAKPQPRPARTRKKSHPEQRPNLYKEPRQLLVWFPGADRFVDCTGRTKYEKLAKEAERNARQKGSTKKKADPPKPAPHWSQGLKPRPDASTTTESGSTPHPSSDKQTSPSGSKSPSQPPSNPTDFDPLQTSPGNYRPRVNGKHGPKRGWFEHMPRQASATKPREFYGLRPRRPRPGSYNKLPASRIPEKSREEADSKTRETIRQAFKTAADRMFFRKRASIDHFIRLAKSVALQDELDRGRGFGNVEQWQEGFPRVEIEITLEMRPGVKEKVLALAVLDDQKTFLAPAKNVGFYMLNPETGRYVLFDGFRELSRKINGEEWAMWEDFFDEMEEEDSA